MSASHSQNNPDVLIYGPSKPIIDGGFPAHYTLHKCENKHDLDRLPSEVAARISGVAVSGLVQADGAMMARFPKLEIVSSFGSATGYIAVLVLALYIQDPHTAELYASPKFIWLACPLLLYWISRTWLIAHRGQMHDDPIVFALTDRVSWAIGVCLAGVFALATLVP